MPDIKKLLKRETELLTSNPEFKSRSIKDIMLHVSFTDGHIHSVYPQKDIAIDMTESAIEELGIKTNEQKTILPKRIIFHNRQAIGDILMMTCCIRDFKKSFPDIQVKVETTAMHIWDYNPNICNEKWEGSILDAKENTQDVIKEAIEKDLPVRIYIGSGKGTNASNRSDKHFANAYRMSIEDTLNIKIQQGPIRPDIYMPEKEYNKEPIIKQPYWLITAGEKGDWTCKTFSFEKWQKVINTFPEIKFVQLGSASHKHEPLVGANVINYIGKTEDRNTGIRDLFNLFLNCEGSIGLVSFQMHLAAAFNKPCVVMAGAREPVWFTRYPGQRYLASDGCLPCTVKSNDEPTSCWFCKIERCKHKENDIPECVNIFNSGDIIEEIKRYYIGGRLSLNKSSKKSKLVNIVKDSDIKPAEEKNDKDKFSYEIIDGKCVDKSKFGMEFGGGSITTRDWEFIQETIEKYKIETVLEFGAGLSTLLLNSIMTRRPVTYETNIGWIKKIKEINGDCDIRKWDGIKFHSNNIGNYDLAFVDGPAGGENREESMKIASRFAKIVIVHDAGRVPERKWQDKYLKDDFVLEEKGGHRCHLWVRPSNGQSKQVKKESIQDITLNNNPCDTLNDKQIIRVLFNGRGEGGAEKSTTWIMNKFIELGWRVQYFSPSGCPSGEFKKNGNKKVEMISDIELGTNCDILFLYTNDWVWDFKLQGVTSIIHKIPAQRKVMAINYRIGDIGTQKALWTIGWDKYILLNSSIENVLLDRMPKSKTKILPPPTDLTKFFVKERNYTDSLKLIRHSSQGDAKYPKNFNEMIERVLKEIPDSEIFLMPAPTFLSEELKQSSRMHLFKRNYPEVNEFLKYGNVFWYSLPEGYGDQGPKVILEAMASGLPVIADNHSGPKDRVIEGTGYLCNNFNKQIEAMKKLDNKIKRGLFSQNATKHAKENFIPDNWIKEIIG